MNGLPDTNTQTTDVEKIKYQSDVNLLLSQSQVPGSYSKYPKITIEEVKAFLQDEATLKNVKSSRQSKRNSKVMKFKFLDGKDSDSGVPELITAAKAPNNKKDSKPEAPKLAKATEKPDNKKQQPETGVSELTKAAEKPDNKKQQQPETGASELTKAAERLYNKKNSETGVSELTKAAERLYNKKSSEAKVSKTTKAPDKSDNKKGPEARVPEPAPATKEPENTQNQIGIKPTHYQGDINLSLSKSLVPTNYAKYPRITVATKTEGKKTANRKRIAKPSINPAKIPPRILRATLSEMSSKQLANVLTPLATEKLQFIHSSITKILEAKNREVIAAKQAQIEKLRKEIQDLQPS